MAVLLIAGFAVFLVIGIHFLLPAIVPGKSDVPGFFMKGAVANVSASGGRIHFTFTGTFRISQYHRFRRSTVEIDCKRGISATVYQGDLFVAEAPDGRSGAVRPAGALLKILDAAADHNRVVNFELYDVKMTMGTGNDFGAFMLSDAGVVRATDADLDMQSHCVVASADEMNNQ